MSEDDALEIEEQFDKNWNSHQRRDFIARMERKLYRKERRLAR